MFEGPAGDMRHDEREPGVTEVADLVDANDIRVIELRDQARLALEAGQRLFVFDVIGANELDRDFASGGAVARQIHDGRSPATQLAEYFVIRREHGERAVNPLSTHYAGGCGGAGMRKAKSEMTASSFSLMRIFSG